MKKRAEELDIAHLFALQAGYAKKIQVAESALGIAQAKLCAFNQRTRKKLGKLIGAGASTGDPLRDEALLAFGLDEVVLERLMSFNDRLVKAKGKEFLLVFSGTVQPGRIIYFGILSGERLRIECGGRHARDFKAILPLERCVIDGTAAPTFVSTYTNGLPFEGTRWLGLNLSPHAIFAALGVLPAEEKVSDGKIETSVLVGDEVGDPVALSKLPVYIAGLATLRRLCKKSRRRA